MACGSCNKEPCAPEPYRCSCQRDCWVGEPGDYQECMDACDPDCVFPIIPGTPGRGYRCDNSAHADCISGCEEDRLDALSDCDEPYSDCQDACTSESCFDLCFAELCKCQADAYKDYSNCAFGCDGSLGLAAWFACSDGKVEEAKECCDTDLGDCYAHCEHGYNVSITPGEVAYFACQKAGFADFYKNTHAKETGDGGSICLLTPDTGWFMAGCDAGRVVAHAPANQERRICRAKCERDELEDDRPEDRKRPACGGRYHLEKETCRATYEADSAENDSGWLVAVHGCYQTYIFDADYPGDQKGFDSCLASAAEVYYTAQEPILFAFVDCRFDACKKEHALVNNQHEYAECWLEKYKAAYAIGVTCMVERNNCRVDCEGDTGCMAGCDGVFSDCTQAVADSFKEDLRANCEDKPSDCPNCGAEAVDIPDEIAYPKPGPVDVGQTFGPVMLSFRLLI
jgi:hypothetical protein